VKEHEVHEHAGTHSMFPWFHAPDGNWHEEKFMHFVPGAALGCALAALATAAGAQGVPASPIYLQLDGGASIYNTKISGLTDHFDTGWGIDGRLGRHVGRIFRTELELGYEEANTDVVGMKGKVSNFDIMANGILDIPTESSFMPYLGLGVGGTRVEADVTAPPVPRFDDAEWAFAYQALGGVDWQLNPHTTLGARYRYLDAQPVHLAGFKTDHNSGLASLGLKFTY
jgi:opacity protein-like surface antigen